MVPCMNIKSLLVLAASGAAVAFTTGCSSTGYSSSDSTMDQNAAYRFVSSSGWTPITDVRQLGKFPLEYNPVTYETYTFAVPVANSQTIAATDSLPEFREDLQPGEAFVEAAGADAENPTVKRVILYSPFGRTGL